MQVFLWLSGLYIFLFGQVEVDSLVVAAINLYQNARVRLFLPWALAGSLSLIIFRELIALALSCKSAESTENEPLLLPVRVRHRRFLPKKHAFDSPYLMTLIPVDWEGNSGGILSLRSKEPGCHGVVMKWLRWFVGLDRRAWWTVSCQDLLLPGDKNLSLRERLDIYLRSQVRFPHRQPKHGTDNHY